MEYIKKEDLIIGETYKVVEGNYWMIGLIILPNNGDNNGTTERGRATLIDEKNKFLKDKTWCYQGNNRTYKLATSEEKHWLTTYIEADTFVTYDEAIKTFIPEYVECVKQFVGSAYKLGIIYKTNTKGLINGSLGYYQLNKDRFKPSTKEAYDAQFVVKEPEFVLPKLWHIVITNENYKILNTYFSNKLPNSILYTRGIMGFYKQDILGHTTSQIKGYDWDFGIEITLEQFKKYVLKKEIIEEVKVIKQLPQFKVIESIETITKVENNEGNQFFIGDTIKISVNLIQKIASFSYNENKTEIRANFNPYFSININDIEHYVEHHVESK